MLYVNLFLLLAQSLICACLLQHSDGVSNLAGELSHMTQMHDGSLCWSSVQQ